MEGYPELRSVGSQMVKTIALMSVSGCDSVICIGGLRALRKDRGVLKLSVECTIAVALIPVG